MKKKLSLLEKQKVITRRLQEANGHLDQAVVRSFRLVANFRQLPYEDAVTVVIPKVRKADRQLDPDQHVRSWG